MAQYNILYIIDYIYIYIYICICMILFSLLWYSIVPYDIVLSLYCTYIYMWIHINSSYANFIQRFLWPTRGAVVLLVAFSLLFAPRLLRRFARRTARAETRAVGTDVELSPRLGAVPDVFPHRTMVVCHVVIIVYMTLYDYIWFIVLCFTQF